MKMDLALNNPQWLICHETKPPRSRCSKQTPGFRLERFCFVPGKYGAILSERNPFCQNKIREIVLIF